MQKDGIGTLYIVATPIGNLSDITIRVSEILKKVNCILSEDTRETEKLLQRLNINVTQKSYRDQNHVKIIGDIISKLKNGDDLALISDSGTPLISDPGFKLVSTLLKEGFNVVSIPGPSAVISALVSSGLPTDKFTFVGFLPRGKNQRVRILKQYGSLGATLTIYESPYRVQGLLKEIIEVLGDRYVCLANELTKLHEKYYRGNASKLIDELEGVKLKGEFVVLISKEGFSNA